jgi:hypothetical protein
MTHPSGWHDFCLYNTRPIRIPPELAMIVQPWHTDGRRGEFHELRNHPATARHHPCEETTGPHFAEGAMATVRCGQCRLPFLREEIIDGRCPACGAALTAPPATARFAARGPIEDPDVRGASRWSILLAALLPLILAAGLYLAFKNRFDPAREASPLRDNEPLASAAPIR